MQFWEHRKISGIAVFEVSGSYRIQIQCIASSAGSILIEIEELTILTQFFRIEIVKKSIFEKLKKIEIELQNRNY